MIESYKKVVFENYANFRGRARRSEYWYFILAQILIFIAIVGIGSLIGFFFDNSEDGFFIAYGFFVLYLLAMLIPYLAVVVRRLHDIGNSGWYYLVSFIPGIGGIWMLIMMCTEGNHGTNDYGPDPKEDFDEISEIGNVEF
jgi:uncharacterized membrane protein YhaH (DUF805 family)